MADLIFSETWGDVSIWIDQRDLLAGNRIAHVIVSSDWDSGSAHMDVGHMLDLIEALKRAIAELENG